MKIRQRTLEPNHPFIAISLNNLALLHCELENYRKAKRMFKKSLKILDNNMERRYPYTATVLNNFAFLHINQNQFRKALPLLNNALEILSGFQGDPSDIALIQNNIAIVYGNLSESNSALTANQKAICSLIEALNHLTDSPKRKELLEECQKIQTRLKSQNEDSDMAFLNKQIAELSNKVAKFMVEFAKFFDEISSGNKPISFLKKAGKKVEEGILELIKKAVVYGIPILLLWFLSWLYDINIDGIVQTLKEVRGIFR